MNLHLHEIPSPLSEIILLAALVLAAILLQFFLIRFSGLIARKQGFDKKHLKMLKKPILMVFIVIALMFGFNILELNEPLLEHPIVVLLIISITWLFINIVKVGGNLLLLQYDMGEEDNLQARKVYTQIRVFERIIIVLILVLGLGLALMTFDSIRHFGVSLLTSAGIAGIIIGLAAQRLIGNILAGLQLAITQPVRIDDVVIVEGEWGWIEEITLTFVTIRIWDKRRLVVPSTYFIEKPFQNWTRNSADILGTVFLYTDYLFPVDELRKEVERLLRDNKLWDQKVNVTQVTNTSERIMEIRVLVSAKDSPTAWDLRVFLREKLIDFIQKNYPQHLPVTRIDMKSSYSSLK